MLHRALASLVCALGVATIALGVASATVWRPSDTLVAEATAGPGSTLLVTEPGVLTMAAPEVTITVTGDDVVIVLGRTADVEAWVGRDAHTTVTGLADWHVLATSDVAARPDLTDDAEEPAPPDGEDATEEPTEPADGAEAEDPTEPTEGAAAEDAGAEAAEDGTADAEGTPDPPDPSGSDMWWDEVSGTTSAEMVWTETDGRWSVLAASTAVGAEAPRIALTWPQEVVTPWLWPGVFLGSLLLLIGLAWWALILVAGRRQARAASGVEPEPEPQAAVPAVPLTRRQIREAAASQAPRARRSQERDSIVDRFPMLVPAPRKVTPPNETEVALAAPEGVPMASEPDAARPRADRSSRRRFALPALRRRGQRPRSTPDEGGDSGPAQRPLPLSPAGAPAGSADAWRRTWGLPDAEDEGSPTDGVQR